MSPFTIVGRKSQRIGLVKQCGGRWGRLPWLERLEDRTTPSTFQAVNTQDACVGSLRWALSEANAHRKDILTANASVSRFRGSGTRYSFTMTPTRRGPFSARVAPRLAHDRSGSPSNQVRRTFDGTAQV